MNPRFPKVSSLRDAARLRQHLAELGAELPCDDAAEPAPSSALARPLELRGPGSARWTLGNRFVIQPMEGWDGTPEGRPSELTLRRWQTLGRSGAGWIRRWPRASAAPGPPAPGSRRGSPRTTSAAGLGFQSSLEIPWIRSSSQADFHGSSPSATLALT